MRYIMKKEEMIKCFAEDKGNAELKTKVARLVDKLNKVSTEQIFAGVEVSALYVLDMEYHIFCGRKHITIRKEQQDPWLPDYYKVVSSGTKKPYYYYNIKQLEMGIKEILKNFIKGI